MTTSSLRGLTPTDDRITVDDYERMVDSAELVDARVELLRGRFLSKTPKDPPHAATTSQLDENLRRILPPGWHIRMENAVRIPQNDEPEPDLMVVAGACKDYRKRHPGPMDVALLVEVAESSLSTDRGEKPAAYAAAGIPVYWIVNLVDRQIEVSTQPAQDWYLSRLDFLPGREVPVVIDGAQCGAIAVAELVEAEP
jgi:Uma2 family endonuclease